MKFIKLAFFQSTLFTLTVLFHSCSFAQKTDSPVMNWLTFEQVKTLNKENPRPILVFFYKSSDDSAKLMLNTTFSQKEVCAYTSSKFYSVKIDVSSKENITFMDGKVYKKNPSKPYHDIATFLLGDKPKMPTVMLYDTQNNGFQFPGFKTYPDMLCMLVYIAENIQETTKYEIWAPAYFHTFPPGKADVEIPIALKWVTLSEALKLNHDKPKGIFLTFYSNTNAASSVMLANAFSHRKVIEYLENHFYCVRIDAQTNDTLVWDKPYYNKHQAGNYHEMATIMMKNKMEFPSMFFIDADNKLIINENSYLSGEALYLLSNFVGKGAYKNTTFPEFMKTFKFEFTDIVPREY